MFFQKCAHSLLVIYFAQPFNQHASNSAAAAEAPLLGREEEATWSPKLDINHQNTKEATPPFIQRLPTMIRTRLIGWKFGVTGWAVGAILTLFINIGLSIFATVGSHRGFNEGIGTLLQDECSKITRYNIGDHQCPEHTSIKRQQLLHAVSVGSNSTRD